MLGKSLKNLIETQKPRARAGRSSHLFTPLLPLPSGNLKADLSQAEVKAYLDNEIATAEAVKQQQVIRNLKKAIRTPDVCDYINEKCIDTTSVSTKTWNYAAARGVKTFGFQERILRHVLSLDPKTGRFPYRTILWSAPKKSMKTSTAAFVGCWFSEFIEPPNYVLVGANTQGQAVGRIFEAMAITLKYQYPDCYRKSDKQIVLPHNGTVVQAITNDPESEAGGSYGLVLISELWGWDGDRAKTLWAETMPVPTRQNSIRWVESYVGYEDSSELMLMLWKYIFTDTTQINLADGAEAVPELADITTTDTAGNIIPCCHRNLEKGFFAFVDHEHRLPDQTEKYYAETTMGLDDADILRLKYNRWSLTQNPLCKPEEIKTAAARGRALGLDLSRALTSDGSSLFEGFPSRVPAKFKMSFALDASMGRVDTAAIVGVYSEYDETVAPLELLSSLKEADAKDSKNMRVLTNTRFRCGYFEAHEPDGSREFDLDELFGATIVRLWKAGLIKRRDPDPKEKKLIEENPRLIPIAVFYDNFQMMQTAVNLRKYHHLLIKEFSQKTDRILADTGLRRIFKNNQIDLPPDEKLKTHITAAKAKSEAKKGEIDGRIRIVKPDTASQPIDGAVALSMAVYAESLTPPPRRRAFGSLAFGSAKGL